MSKKLYSVEIVETLVKIVSVKANNKDEAYAIIRKKYYDEEIVLESDSYMDTEFNEWEYEEEGQQQNIIEVD
jgi:hypothetical protein